MRVADERFDDEFLEAALKGQAWRLGRLCGASMIGSARKRVELLATSRSLTPAQIARAMDTADRVHRRSTLITPLFIGLCIALLVAVLAWYGQPWVAATFGAGGLISALQRIRTQKAKNRQASAVVGAAETPSPPPPAG